MKCINVLSKFSHRWPLPNPRSPSLLPTSSYHHLEQLFLGLSTLVSSTKKQKGPYLFYLSYLWSLICLKYAFSDVSAIQPVIYTDTYNVSISLAVNIRYLYWIVKYCVFKYRKYWILCQSATKEKSWQPPVLDNYGHWVSTVTGQPLPVTSVSDPA